MNENPGSRTLIHNVRWFTVLFLRVQLFFLLTSFSVQSHRHSTHIHIYVCTYVCMDSTFTYLYITYAGKFGCNLRVRNSHDYVGVSPGYKYLEAWRGSKQLEHVQALLPLETSLLLIQYNIFIFLVFLFYAIDDPQITWIKPLYSTIVFL